jgi:hypothetical protein
MGWEPPWEIPLGRPVGTAWSPRHGDVGHRIGYGAGFQAGAGDSTRYPRRPGAAKRPVRGSSAARAPPSGNLCRWSPSACRHDPRLARVYQFKDAQGRVIYVGKAKSLRSAPVELLPDPNLHPRTAQMVATAETVEWIQVRNEVEALMLEYSLIKQHRPRFNIRLIDDKSYPFLAVTVGDQWPRRW